MEKQQEVSVRHVYRKGNSFIDCLSNLGVNMQQVNHPSWPTLSRALAFFIEIATPRACII